MAKAIREPDIAERMNALGMVLREDGTAHYAAMIKTELDLYAAIVKEANIKIE